jgi:hypothetical protein
MADMPTNESYTLSDEQEIRDDDNAIKFLTETGMLMRLDCNIHFDLNYRSDDSILGDIDNESRVSHFKEKEVSLDNFKFFEDPFEDDGFNPAETLEKQLQKDPIPEPILVDISVSEKHSEFEYDNIEDIELFSRPSSIKEISMSFSLPQTNCNAPTIDASEKMEEPQNKAKNCNKKKLTEFGYLLQRKGFRLMRKYYKERFETFAHSFDYKRRVKVISSGEINQIIMQFINSEFGTILPVLAQNEHEKLLDSLKVIIFSDRSNKNEPMTNGIDFSVCKNLFGKYTQKTMKIFMKDSANSFLYTHFYLINGRSACFDQKDVDQANYNEQMKKLMLEAFRNLFSSVKPLYEKLYEQNSRKI